MNADIIIIGGGLGGLTTGALLAKEGLRVIVLEKNAVIGGGLQTFRRGNIEFETGMHCGWQTSICRKSCSLLP